MEEKKIENEIIKGKQLSDIDNFYITWGKDAIKENISICNSTLEKIMTLSSALAGGGIIQTTISNAFFKTTMVSLFIFSFFISFVGLLPRAYKVNIDNPIEIKEYKQNVFKRKKLLMKIAISFFTLGFLTALFSFFVKI